MQFLLGHHANPATRRGVAFDRVTIAARDPQKPFEHRWPHNRDARGVHTFF